MFKRLAYPFKHLNKMFKGLAYKFILQSNIFTH